METELEDCKRIRDLYFNFVHAFKTFSLECREEHFWFVHFLSNEQKEELLNRLNSIERQVKTLGADLQEVYEDSTRS